MHNTSSLKQKARPALVFFVFGCVLIIVGLLYIMQKAQATADNISYGSEVSKYLD